MLPYENWWPVNFVHSYPQVMPWPLHHSHSSPIHHHHHTRATLHPPTLSWWHQHQHQHQHRSQITTKRRSLSNSNRLSQQLSLAGINCFMCVCLWGREGWGGGRERRREGREGEGGDLKGKSVNYIEHIDPQMENTAVVSYSWAVFCIHVRMSYVLRNKLNLHVHNVQRYNHNLSMDVFLSLPHSRDRPNHILHFIICFFCPWYVFIWMIICCIYGC